MTRGLVRHQRDSPLHFLTFSCHKRLPYLSDPPARDVFEHALERMRQRYHFVVAGYVVMPEHVHLLVSEPEQVLLAKVVQALKLSVAVKSSQRPFWLARYYDFDVFTDDKRKEKLRYIYRNPVTRGLVEKPEEWLWSSFRHWSTGKRGVVEINSVDP